MTISIRVFGSFSLMAWRVLLGGVLILNEPQAGHLPWKLLTGFIATIFAQIRHIQTLWLVQDFI